MNMEMWFSTSDILYEVLSKLCTKELINLKSVSKEWQCLISERSFIKAQLKREPIAGFFYQSRGLCDEDECINFLPVAATEVHSNILDFLPEPTLILTSCYGLICTRTCFPCSTPCIYVCNPLNREWKKLHWPNPSRKSCITLAFDPFKNPMDAVTNFKVVIVSQNESSAEGEAYFCFDLYSSETEEWTRSIETCFCSHNMQKKASMCVQGILYWLTDGNQILMFDPENEKSWLIMVPLPTTQIKSRPEMCMGEAEGKLHYVLISEEGLRVWTLVDHTVSKWDLIFTSTLEVLGTELQKQKHFSHLEISKKLFCDYLTDSPWWVETLSFKDNILLMRVGADLFLHQFKTRKMKHLGRLDALGKNGVLSAAVCPYTMSLVPLGEA